MPSVGSLADGFEEFVSWSDGDLGQALNEGLVVVDTNVLLDLYRYDPEVRQTLLSVLQLLGDRLFIPNQVAAEFWKNRESALEDRALTAQGVIERLDGGVREIEQAVANWGNRSGALSEAMEEDLKAVLELVEGLGDRILAEAEGTDHDRDTGADAVLASILTVAEGKVGPAPTAEVLAELIVAGHQRASDKVPPGYKDGGKEDDGVVGDFLVWRQTLDEAASRTVERIVFVTSDQKEDWVHKVKGQKRGARRELRREAMLEAGSDLAVISPLSLLKIADDALGADVDEATVNRLGAIGKRSDRGWDHENVAMFRSLVAADDPMRSAVLEHAIQNAGYVDRDEVYEICDFSGDRTLRGFTRPYSRLKRQMIMMGRLSDGAEDPVVAIYEDPKNYFLASGFSVPNAFLDSHQTAD